MRSIHVLAFFAVILLTGCSHSNNNTGEIHHDIHVIVDPDNASIQVTDSIVFPKELKETRFVLNKNFDVRAIGAKIRELDSEYKKHFRYYQLSEISPNQPNKPNQPDQTDRPDQSDRKVQIIYQGKLTKSFSPSKNIMPNIIFDEDFFYLDGSSAWYPRFDNAPYVSFSLTVEKPIEWEIISQGKRTKTDDSTSYEIDKPQDDIYLLGGKYNRYSRTIQLSDQDIEIEVYLFSANPALARKYLDKSVEYITDFSETIGSYPYSKFAVVENSYQTGFGMPGFTLLGSRIIRFPFILNSSLPHEILHNWWGNGVFVDYQAGNWSEGLTAYMADHFYQEKIGKDVEYRRKALERYANFADKQRDFPLAEFTSRHNESSQAVGYSKSMMVFHSLRKQVGEQLFDANIKKLWEKFKFKPASFNDVISALASGSQIDVDQFINQWLSGKGAPEVTIDDLSLDKRASGYLLELVLNQNQPGKAFKIHLPIHIYLDSNQSPLVKTMIMNDKNSTLSLKLDRHPNSIQVDPNFDTFRLLSTGERPSSLGRFFGAKQQLLVIPGTADKNMIDAWEELARQWNRTYGNVAVIQDNEIDSLPTDQPVWLLGWENKFLHDSAQRFSSFVYELSTSEKKLTVSNNNFSKEQHALVVMDVDNTKKPFGFISANNAETVKQLARKLPHYKSYGLLVFDAKTYSNILKNHLPVFHSPLKVTFE